MCRLENEGETTHYYRISEQTEALLAGKSHTRHKHVVGCSYTLLFRCCCFSIRRVNGTIRNGVGQGGSAEHRGGQNRQS